MLVHRRKRRRRRTKERREKDEVVYRVKEEVLVMKGPIKEEGQEEEVD